MAVGKGQIGLKLPERRRPSKDEFSLKPDHVEAWILQLPTGSTGETTHHIYDLLYRVNRLDLPWRDRQQFLEQLRPSVEFVQSALKKHYIGIGFPLPLRSRKVADLAQSLYLEMSLGYKIAIEDMLRGNFLQFRKKALSVMLHRAIRYSGRTLLTTYQSYTSAPANTWFELHLLYLHAEERGFLRDTHTDSEGERQYQTSISRLYKQVLLLTLASPYRLRQGEAEDIFKALVNWGAYVEIVPFDHPKRDKLIFAVHMDSDNPPDYQAYVSRPCDNELCRLVDTRPLVKQLHLLLKSEQQTSEEVPEAIEGALSTGLLERLTIAWGQSPKRHYQRNWKESTLEVIVGLTALHQTLSASAGSHMDSSTQVSHYASRTVVSPDSSRGDDVWNIFAAPQEKQTSEKSTITTRRADVSLQNWFVNNESAGGYRLTTQPNLSTKIHVGELLGVRSHSSNHWEVALVRWIRQAEEQALELGVQVLAPEALPVRVKHWEQRHTSSDFQRALLLPPVKSAGIEPSILMPIRLFKAGQKLLVNTAQTTTPLYLNRQLFDSGSFVQFSYTDQKASAGDPTVTVAKMDDSPFADLWSEL